jgi:hypothetical protein
MDEVRDLNLAAKEVTLRERTLKYDYLILAVGGCTSYFGHPEWAEFAPGLKSLEDAIRIRREVLLAFERIFPHQHLSRFCLDGRVKGPLYQPFKQGYSLRRRGGRASAVKRFARRFRQRGL